MGDLNILLDGDLDYITFFQISKESKRNVNGMDRFGMSKHHEAVCAFTEPFELKPLIQELGFVTNKAMREIPDENYERIIMVGS